MGCFAPPTCVQELSVWAGGASNQQQQPLQAAPWADARAGSGSAEATGVMARSLMAAYQELQSVMEALGTVMVQHQALKVGVSGHEAGGACAGDMCCVCVRCAALIPYQRLLSRGCLSNPALLTSTACALCLCCRMCLWRHFSSSGTAT